MLASGPAFQNIGTVRVSPAEPGVFYVGDYGKNGVFRLNRATGLMSAINLGETTTAARSRWRRVVT